MGLLQMTRSIPIRKTFCFVFRTGLRFGFRVKSEFPQEAVADLGPLSTPITGPGPPVPGQYDLTQVGTGTEAPSAVKSYLS